MKNKYYILAAQNRIKDLSFKLENNGFKESLVQTIVMYNNFIYQLRDDYIIYDNKTIKNIKKDLKHIAKEIKKGGWF